MSVALLLALLQPYPVAPPAPPPPIVTTAVVPPPMIVPAISPPIAPMLRAISPPVVVDVRVTTGNQTLFADQMRVDGLMGASFSQNRSEAMARTCPADRYDRQQSTMFTLRLNSRNVELGGRLMSVSVTWSRPIESNDCANSGTRSASISQTVAYQPGKPIILTGDGGLRVELRPR